MLDLLLDLALSEKRVINVTSEDNLGVGENGESDHINWGCSQIDGLW